MKLIYLAPAAFALAACAGTPSPAGEAERATQRAEITCRYEADEAVGGDRRRTCRTNGEWAAFDREGADRRDRFGLSVSRSTHNSF